ncbi:hypothetical protein CRE_06193 [Caenorhabditis remanei]|uniref:Uncharacterized protein n=1 Tax=Caenorhabditis remanei TaxID=31234 RepID=E3NLJ1_CAERE|nr:hypothetical protein CRE_20157 [Caenorhabditis remanei]EFP04914.1 hypothetical protein CRE_06193 [Caenorhabditis remanei]
MLSRIDPKSQDFITEELDFSTLPATQCGIINSRFSYVPLKNQLTESGPWELNLANNNLSYMNPKKTYIVFTFKITDEAGNRVEMGGTPELLYGPINNIAHSIIKSYTMHINGQMVFHNSTNYAYQSYLESVLMHGEEIKNSTLTSAGFFHDEVVGSPKSSGFLKRCEMVYKDGAVQVACNISIDLMNQNKVLINGCDVKLTLYPNTSEFLIEGYNLGANKLKFHVTDVFAMVNEFDLAEGLSNEIELALQSHKNIQYPLISPQVRSFYIEPNRFDAPANTIFTSKMPRRIFVGLVSAEAYNGSYNTSPFNFQHFDISQIHIDYCGQSVPGRPFNLDFESGKFIEPYILMQEALGHARTNFTSNSISKEMFRSAGYTIFGFELSVIAQDHNLFELVKQTNVSVRLNFAKKTPAGGLYAIIYGEFDNLLNINELRVPLISTIV